MKVVCLLLAATLLAGVSSVAVDNCSWGPSYWCLSLENANKCEQVKYCKDKVWTDKLGSAILVHGAPIGNQKKLIDLYKNTVSSPKNEIECEACKIVVGYLDQQLKKNATEAEAKAEVEQVCSIAGSLAAECKSLVDSYFDTIWQALINNANPDTLCTTISLCSSKKAPAVTAGTVSSPKNIIECEACKIVVGYLDQQLEKNATEAEAKAEVEQVCSIAGSLAAECKSLVDSYFDTIWQALINNANPDTLCSTISLCSSKKAPAVAAATVSSLKNEVECEACKIVVGYLDQQLKKNATESEAKAEVEQVCTFLGSLAADCKDIVDQNFDTIWQLLINNANPDTLCSTINLCSSKKAPAVTAATVSFPKNEIECEACKFVVGYLDKQLENKATEDQAKAAVEGMCALLGSLDNACKTLIDDNFDMIWKLVVSEASADEICSEIKVCASKSRKTVQLTAVPEATPTLTSSIKCDVCEVIAKKVIAVLQKQSTKDDAKAAMMKMCDDILKPITTECDSFVNSHFDQIWEAITKGTSSPAVFCDQFMSGCTSVSSRSRRGVISNTECKICKGVVGLLLKKFADTTSITNKVTAMVDPYCDGMPSTEEKEQCKTFINATIAVVVKDAFKSSALSPEGLCQSINYCKSTEVADTITKRSVDFKADECEICEKVVEVVENSATEEIAKEALSTLCKAFGPAEILCTFVVNKYFDEIWNYVENKVGNATEICHKLELCKSANRQFMMLSLTASPKPPLKQSACDICKLVSSYLKVVVDNNSTEQEVKAELEQLCSLLPSSTSGQCKTLVDGYFDDIWALIKREVDSGEICQMIGLCNATAVFQKKSVKNSVRKPEDATCDECKLIMQYIDTFIKSNGSQQEIKEYLDDFCNLLGQAKDECTQLVDQYLPLAWVLLESELKNATEICQLLNLCPKMRKLIKSPSASKCEICEDVITGLKDVLPFTSKLTVDGLKDACKLFPSDVASECSAIVVEYGPEIIKLLDDAINPQAICKAITLCS